MFEVLFSVCSTKRRDTNNNVCIVQSDVRAAQLFSPRHILSNVICVQEP